MQELNVMRRSTLVLGVLGTLALGLSSCNTVSQPNVQTLLVAPNKGDCKGGFEPFSSPRLLTRAQSSAAWECFYNSIDGFTYEPGSAYKLSVEVKRVTNPPADAPDRTYTLLNVVEKTPSSTVAVPGQP